MRAREGEWRQKKGELVTREGTRRRERGGGGEREESKAIMGSRDARGEKR